MATLFISDLHLDPNHPEITQLFLDFLHQQAIHAEALYILGDLFEAWIGDDNNNELIQLVKKELKQLNTVSIPVYFMAGNRDFLIGEQFATDTACEILADPTVINLYGTPTLLTHGDSLCTKDKRHQYFRKISQHPVTKKLFIKLPLKIRQKIAGWLRGKSQTHQQKLDYVIMDVVPDAVKNLMQQYQVTQLIHGHTHRPAIHDENGNKRIVLGAWHNEVTYLHCSPQQLKLFS